MKLFLWKKSVLVMHYQFPTNFKTSHRFSIKKKGNKKSVKKCRTPQRQLCHCFTIQEWVPELRIKWNVCELQCHKIATYFCCREKPLRDIAKVSSKKIVEEKRCCKSSSKIFLRFLTRDVFPQLRDGFIISSMPTCKLKLSTDRGEIWINKMSRDNRV